ncbi:MAG: hypothetical protein KF788_04605 [Piscinibacter sp.]|nr:hypothetical protein [Piscinibacter sp.]
MRASIVSVPAVAACALLALGSALPVQAQGIYTCEVNGRRVTSDRPIPECVHREQRLLNSDGSVKRIVPPTLTADERAAQEARDAKEALERANRREAIRRDRNLLMRFPDQAAHDRARESALEDLRKSLQISESRLERLQKERKPLMDETEFYVGKPLPLNLKRQIEGNEAAAEAQRALVTNQQAELVRINALYDAELERLRQLWAGALPGSLGPLPMTPSAVPASAPRPRSPA